MLQENIKNNITRTIEKS